MKTLYEILIHDNNKFYEINKVHRITWELFNIQHTGNSKRLIKFINKSFKNSTLTYLA